MPHQSRLISQMIVVAERLGLAGTAPIVLSDGGNLICHLAPYPVVARLAAVISKEDTDLAFRTTERELRVADHLKAKGVPVLSPTSLAEAGPYDVDGTWMTLWDYIPPTQLQRPSPNEAAELVTGLSMAMKDYPGDLPSLGVWERTGQAAARLKNNSDHRVQGLLEVFLEVDQQMRSRERMLIPCHGDAHAGNLIPSPEGWLWMDLEDACLMPAYWDIASYVGNLSLFGGFQQPTFRYFLSHTDIASDPNSFGLALTARTLMSTLGNLDFALAGHVDLDFAARQLELAGDFLRHIDRFIVAN